MKKYLFGILAITLTVGFSAFTTKKAPKPFTSQDVWLADGSDYQRMESGAEFGDDPLTSLTLSRFATQIASSQWTTTPASFTVYTSGPSYLIKFTIDKLDVTGATDDTNDSDGISVAQALAALQEVNNSVCTPDLFSSGAFVYPSGGTVVVDPNADASTVTITFVKNAVAH